MNGKIIVCAGMPRAGTTFLYYNLKKHPDINAASLKEINYFSFNYDKGEDWLKALFEDRSKHDKSWLDVSPVYFFDNKSFERLRDSGFEVKLIIGLREPSTWIPSIFNQVSKHTIKKLDWNEFQQGFQWNVEGNIFSLDFQPGFFKKQVKSILSQWNGDLFLYDYRFLDSEPLKLLQQIEEFCGISEHFNELTFENKIVNAGGRKSNRLVTMIGNNRLVKQIITSLLPDKVLSGWRDVAVSSTAQVRKSDSVQTKIVDADYSIDKEYLDHLLNKGTKRINKIG